METYNIESLHEYVKLATKHMKKLQKAGDLIKMPSLLPEVSVTLDKETSSVNIELYINKPINMLRVEMKAFPLSKLYGKKRNKMINTYHKY